MNKMEYLPKSCYLQYGSEVPGDMTIVLKCMVRHSKNPDLLASMMQHENRLEFTKFRLTGPIPKGYIGVFLVENIARAEALLYTYGKSCEEKKFTFKVNPKLFEIWWCLAFGKVYDDPRRKDYQASCTVPYLMPIEKYMAYGNTEDTWLTKGDTICPSASAVEEGLKILSQNYVILKEVLTK